MRFGEFQEPSSEFLLVQVKAADLRGLDTVVIAFSRARRIVALFECTTFDPQLNGKRGLPGAIGRNGSPDRFVNIDLWGCRKNRSGTAFL